MPTLEEQYENIARLSRLYYEGTPEVEDSTFDALLNEYIEAGGTETVGHGYTPKDRKVTHATRMGSLKKINETSDDKDASRGLLLTWLEAMKEYYEENADTSTPLTISVSPKFDGLALSVIVKNGKIERAATRGDGITGENVTRTALNVADIQALTSQGDGEYRGEILLPQENLEAANERREPNSEPLTQVRNAASGIIRKFNDTFKASETLVFANHDAGEYVKTYTYSELIQALPAILAYYEPLRETFPVKEGKHVGIDGVVFKVENADVRDGVGESSGSPRWARAYKYADAVYESRVTGVIWGNPGKIGRITPVVTYESIPIAGGNYTQATAHNLTLFNAFDPRVGDAVEMRKAGDVIPYIVSITPAETNRGPKFEKPSTCPLCGAPTAVDGEFLICTADRVECDPISGLTLIITGLGIKGIRENIVSKVYNAHLVGSPSLHHALNTMRTLPDGSIAELEGLGQKSEETVKQALNTAWSSTPLWAWIYGLNVSRVGESVSQALADTYGSLDGILNAIDDPDTHYRTARHLTGVNWDHIVQGRKRFADLRDWMTEAGVTLPAPEQDTVVQHDDRWTGKKVALTGSLQVSRSEAEAWLKSRGAIPQKSLSGSTDILIDAGDGTSTKSRKAQKQGTAVVTGDEFMAQYGE